MFTVAISLETNYPNRAGEEFLDALSMLSRGHHAAVLRSLAAGATFMPRIKESTGFQIDEAAIISVLKELMNCGAVARSVHSGPPLRVEYHLTEAGRTLDSLILSAQTWTQRWAYAPPVSDSRRFHQE